MRAKFNRRGWVLVGVAVVLAAVSAVLARPWLPGSLASGVGAGFLVVAGVWSARGVAVLQGRDAQLNVLIGAIWHSKRGTRLPLVCDLKDPFVMGVHPAAIVRDSPGNRVPPFIARDIDPELRRALREDRFVLLVGESTAGKSRAAYEAVRAELPHHRVVNPTRRDVVLTAAECASANRRTVLWLDDLERFLGSGGLTGEAVRKVLDAKGASRYVIATMRSEEYVKFSGRASLGLEGIGRDALRQGWDVIRLATRIDVSRIWSEKEIDEARQMTGDVRIAEAVGHAHQYGIAEYLAAGPQLLAEWRDAWAPATHPRAAAMVLAAVDARRAGLHRPLTSATLAELHRPYLQRRGGERLRPESIEEALSWASTPLYATSSLLMPTDDGFLAFDYLIDTVDQDRIPAEALDALIPTATPGEALDIGQMAWSWSLIDQAGEAFHRAEAGGLFEATIRRSYVVGESQGSSAGLHFAQEAAEWTAAVNGPDHHLTLEARGLVAEQTQRNGDLEDALKLFQDLIKLCESTLGAAHRITLNMRSGVAAITGELGSQSAAAEQYQQLSADCSRILGEDHYKTIVCRDQAAMWFSEAGESAQAEYMFRELLEDMSQRYFSKWDDLFHTRSQLACCLSAAGNYDLALKEWELLVAEAISSFGRLRSTSFYVREQHAWCVGESGHPERAVDLFERIAIDATELKEPRTIYSIFAYRGLAWWIGETGNPVEAECRLAALIDSTIALRGANDRRVHTLKLMHAHWRTLNDSSASYSDDLQRNISLLVEHLGPKHEVTRAALRHLDVWDRFR